MHNNQVQTLFRIFIVRAISSISKKKSFDACEQKAYPINQQSSTK